MRPYFKINQLTRVYNAGMKGLKNRIFVQLPGIYQQYKMTKKFYPYENIKLTN